MSDMWPGARSLWRALRHRASFERGMDEDLRFHLEARAADLTRSGLSPSAFALRPLVDKDPASFLHLHTTYTGDRARVGLFATSMRPSSAWESGRSPPASRAGPRWHWWRRSDS